jgi:hypothetical protein
MTKLPTIYFATALILSCTGSATAEDRAQAAQLAVNNMAQETVECAAYFDIVSLALLHSNEGATAQEYLKARKLALDRAESLSEGIVAARYNITIRDMTNRIVITNITKRIDKSLSNVLITDISVLGDHYGKLCKEVLSEPGARAKYWMERVGPSR